MRTISVKKGKKRKRKRKKSFTTLDLHFIHHKKRAFHTAQLSLMPTEAGEEGAWRQAQVIKYVTETQPQNAESEKNKRVK